MCNVQTTSRAWVWGRSEPRPREGLGRVCVSISQRRPSSRGRVTEAAGTGGPHVLPRSPAGEQPPGGLLALALACVLLLASAALTGLTR